MILFDKLYINYKSNLLIRDRSLTRRTKKNKITYSEDGKSNKY